MDKRVCRVILLWSLVVFGGCAKALPPRTDFVLGTFCTVNLYERGSAALYQDVFDRFREIEERMSVNLEDSDLSRVNARAGREAVRVHGDVVEVIAAALGFAEISGGALDPAVGPLVRLWGIGFEEPRLPGREEIDAVLPLLDWRNVRIDGEEVFLTRPGMALDLGAIAKGYAADEAARIIKKAGAPRGIIDLGGNILAIGERADKSPWRVGIQDPLGERGAYVGIMNIRNKSLVTSGVYERYFELGGMRYHHILSPEDGYPVRNGLLSVTIIADRSIDADALATAVFVLGYEGGKTLVDSLDNTEVLFIFEDKSVRGSAGALRDFTLTDSGYRLESQNPP